MGEIVDRPGITIWKDAVRIQFNIITQSMLVVPMLFVPVLNDILSAVLIRQYNSANKIEPRNAISESITGLIKLIRMKLYFEIRSMLWALIPIYGYIKALRHRQYWAMASNVLVFEGNYGEKGIKRCRDIIDNHSSGLATRTLITIPTILLFLVTVVWVISGTMLEMLYFPGFVTIIVFIYIITVPVSGAVNTLLYLRLIK